MRLGGKKSEGLNNEDIISPRGNGEDLHFKAQAVVNFEEFEALCPRPKPRRARNGKGEVFEDTKDSTYQLAVNQYAERRLAYMLLKSLEATPDLEWETVNINNPDTWTNWQVELREAGLVEPEIARIVNGILSACGLDESKVEKARERFLVSQRAEREEQLFQRDELNSTQSGELASDSN